MIGPGMIITKVRYEVIEWAEWQQKPTYRRFSDGFWEVQRWSEFDEEDYWSPLANAKMERLLEEEYQRQIKGE